MEDEVQIEAPAAAAVTEAPPIQETPKQEAPKQEAPRQESKPRQDRTQGDRPQGDRPQGDRPKREDRPQGDRPQGDRPKGGPGRDARPEGRGGGDRRPDGGRPDRREGGPRPGGGGDRRPFEMAAEIEIEKLISDSLYLDNQAHAVVARMRDMDSGTKSQLRRLYNAVRRAVRAPESERQHHFVMLRARLAYTIARHPLRSLDALERLLLQVTRKNDARGYERFKDLFEAIVAYNE
jgi:CRISPR type III-A-associated protein Csm2